MTSHDVRTVVPVPLTLHAPTGIQLLREPTSLGITFPPVQPADVVSRHRLRITSIQPATAIHAVHVSPIHVIELEPADMGDVLAAAAELAVPECPTFVFWPVSDTSPHVLHQWVDRKLPLERFATVPHGWHVTSLGAGVMRVLTDESHADSNRRAVPIRVVRVRADGTYAPFPTGN